MNCLKKLKSTIETRGLRSKSSAPTSICKLSHRRRAFTTDIEKVDCPSCLAILKQAGIVC